MAIERVKGHGLRPRHNTSRADNRKVQVRLEHASPDA